MVRDLSVAYIRNVHVQTIWQFQIKCVALEYMAGGNCCTRNLFLKTETSPPPLPEVLGQLRKAQFGGGSSKKEKDSRGVPKSPSGTRNLTLMREKSHLGLRTCSLISWRWAVTLSLLAMRLNRRRLLCFTPPLEVCIQVGMLADMANQPKGRLSPGRMGRNVKYPR